MEQAVYIVLVLFVALAIKLWWESNKENTTDGLHFKTGPLELDVSFGSNSEDEEAGDPEVIELIQNAATRRQLLEIAEEYDLEGNENKAMLARALQLNLDPEDWADIHQAAEEGSELETIAKSKAGNALE